MTEISELVGLRVVKAQRGVEYYTEEELVLCGEDGRCFRFFPQDEYDVTNIQVEEIDEDELWAGEAVSE